jgi:hypothetical protein
MGLGSTFNNNDGAAVAQTWVRNQVGEAFGSYINDTKRAAGHRQDAVFRTKNYTQQVSGAGIIMVQQNLKFETQLSTDAVPLRINLTMSMPLTLQNAVTTIRAAQKDFNAFWATGIFGSDAKVDDWTAFRSFVP